MAEGAQPGNSISLEVTLAPGRREPALPHLTLVVPSPPRPLAPRRACEDEEAPDRVSFSTEPLLPSPMPLSAASERVQAMPSRALVQVADTARTNGWDRHRRYSAWVTLYSENKT